ncbi:MAG: hypothetical protein JNN30_13870, partial [Rhodanobacteraceae bacterium]|nr:hypothetical protein [Rhodanobacteraceae bacterium]
SPGARRRGVASLSLVLPFATLKLPALLLSDAQDLFNYVSAKTLAPAAPVIDASESVLPAHAAA